MTMQLYVISQALLSMVFISIELMGNDVIASSSKIKSKQIFMILFDVPWNRNSSVFSGVPCQLSL